MKRTALKRKTPLRSNNKPLRRTSLARGNKPLLRKAPLHVEGKSTATQLKKEIQAYLRLLVIHRDGGCVLRNAPGVPPCNGYRKDGEMIYQADHLITRGNSATFADTRLVVCLCKGHHGWKSVGNNLRKEEYDRIVRSLLSPDRVALWDRCEAESWRPTKMDWSLELTALKQEYANLGITPSLT